MPQVPVWVFILVFVAINTFVTGRGITVTARTNFVLLALELVALANFIAIAIKYVFVDGGGTGGLSLDPLYQPPGIVDLGFGGISTLAEETERPERTVGNTTVAALLILGAIFVRSRHERSNG